jgi:hypothetical protein
VIFFDVTNAVPYTSVYLTLCEIYMKMRNDGCRTPQVAFLTNSHSGKTVQTIYDDFYAKDLFQELWFYWDDKPLILAKEEELSDALKAFFTVRRSWAWDPGKDKWPWLEHSPQQGGWHDNPEVLEQMVAATAQHPTSHNRGLGLGKSFKNGVQPQPGHYESEQGYYFKEQLDHALAAGPAFLFLTQWNEWIAQRFIANKAMTYAGQTLKPGDTYFVDVYSMEFNRDMEPMKGGYQDNYYYQMVDGIRRFKGTRDAPRPSAGKTIDLSQFDGWDDVLPEYRDDRGDVFHRDHPGYGDHQYTNQTGRNDLVLAKVTQDEESLFFYAQTREKLSEDKTENWMNLFIQIEGRDAPHWEGYHYCIRFEDGECGLYACQQGWAWKKIRTIRHGMAPDRLAYAIAKRDIAVEGAFTLRFKWSDNMQEREPLDWILNGDTAPNGRFQYLYRSVSLTQ